MNKILLKFAEYPKAVDVSPVYKQEVVRHLVAANLPIET